MCLMDTNDAPHVRKSFLLPLNSSAAALIYPMVCAINVPNVRMNPLENITTVHRYVNIELPAHVRRRYVSNSIHGNEFIIENTQRRTNVSLPVIEFLINVQKDE